MNTKLERLYSEMQKAKAKEALEAGTVQLSSEEQKMVDLVNAERRKAGVPELKVSPKLCEAAKIRAAKCNIKYDHVRPNGERSATVLEDVGLNISGLSNEEYIYYGENLAGSYKKNPMPAQIAFERFINSSSHKKNMLNENHSYIGIAINYNGKQSSWIQSFSAVQ